MNNFLHAHWRTSLITIQLQQTVLHDWLMATSSGPPLPYIADTPYQPSAGDGSLIATTDKTLLF